MLGTWVEKRWWEQEGLDLEVARAATTEEEKIPLPVVPSPPIKLSLHQFFPKIRGYFVVGVMTNHVSPHAKCSVYASLSHVSVMHSCSW